MVPKIKPTLDSPKLSGRILGTVKDASSILKSHYGAQKALNAPRTKSDENEGGYAQRNTFGRAKSAIKTETKGFAGRTAKEYNKRTKQVKNAKKQMRKRLGLANKWEKLGAKISSRASRIKTPKTAGVTKAVTKRGKEAAKQQAIKLAKIAAKTAKATARRAAQLVVKIAQAFVRLVMSMASAAVPFIAIFLAVAAVAMFVASPFGILLSNENKEPNTFTIASVVQEINAEYMQTIQEIVVNTSHDREEMNYVGKGYKRGDNWIDILAVFAVKTALAEDGMDVITIDATRKQIIKNIFWDMVEISHDTRTEESEVPVYDDEGKPTDETETIDETILTITVTRKTAQEQATEYAFNQKQNGVLTDLLSGDYDGFFNELLKSTTYASGDGTGVVGSGDFIWPSVTCDIVNSPYGPRIHPVYKVPSFHSGIDIPAGENTEVVAADAGTVEISVLASGYGNYILVDHGNGYKSLYAHLNVRLVEVGDTVEQGQVIGLIGTTGTSTGFHLHFEIHENGQRVDPLRFYTNFTVGW